MREIVKAKFQPFFFVPHTWEDLFVDAVIDSYVDCATLELLYHHIPSGINIVEEEEVAQLVERITCDGEYGVHYPEEICFESDEEYNNFRDLFMENLMFSISDINVVFNRYHMSYMIGNQIQNMPVKEVW